MKYLKLVFVLMVFQLCWSCSWVRHFFVVNETNQPIEIEYSIYTPNTPFGIFADYPIVYQLKARGNIDWNSKIMVTDTDTAANVVKVVLPPNSILIFGTLQNDDYSSYDQYFINGRVFNLTKMTISTSTNTIHIEPKTFDNYFKVRKGNIAWIAK